MKNTFDKEKAVELYKEGLSYVEIQKIVDVKGSTLRMFFIKNIKLGKVKSRKNTEVKRYVRKRLKEMRLQKKLKQKEVADLVGVNTTCISSIESCNRNPSFKVALKIKKILEYYDDDLFEEFEVENKL